MSMGMSVPKLNHWEENFENELKESHEFVSYWIEIIRREMCLNLTSIESKELQKKVLCDTQEGFEFKHDKIFSKTGNLWIEVAERHDPANGYIPSGILRDDNTWVYCQGNFRTLFFLSKKHLRKEHITDRWTIKENTTKTSKGFLLKPEEIQDFLIHEIHANI